MKIDIPEMDLYLLLSNVITSSIRNRSYIVGHTSEWIQKYAPKLSGPHIKNILDEIETEIDLCKRDGIDIYDIDKWEEAANRLRKIYETKG